MLVMKGWENRISRAEPRHGFSLRSLYTICMYVCMYALLHISFGKSHPKKERRQAGSRGSITLRYETCVPIYVHRYVQELLARIHIELSAAHPIPSHPIPHISREVWVIIVQDCARHPCWYQDEPCMLDSGLPPFDTQWQHGSMACTVLTVSFTSFSKVYLFHALLHNIYT